MSTNLYPSKRPKVAEVEYWAYVDHLSDSHLAASVWVYRGMPFPDYYKVQSYRAGINKSKLFYGESAWMDVNRYVRDFGFYGWEGV